MGALPSSEVPVRLSGEILEEVALVEAEVLEAAAVSAEEAPAVGVPHVDFRFNLEYNFPSFKLQNCIVPTV